MDFKKQNMDTLPEEIKNFLWEKRIPGIEEQHTPETFIDLYNSVLVDNVVYLKEGYKLPEECFESQFKLAMMVHAIIKENYIIKNRYGYDGKI